MRGAGQLRLAPSGYPIGLDLSALLTLGDALGYDRHALAELLPALEAGLVAGLKTALDRSLPETP